MLLLISARSAVYVDFYIQGKPEVRFTDSKIETVVSQAKPV